jgi:hypothetical protein
MNESDKGINLVTFSAEGFLMNNHQMEVRQHSDHPQRLCQSFSIRAFALDLTNSLQELLIRYRLRCASGSSDPCSWFDIIDELSILTCWAANWASLTLQSISAHDRIEFKGKPILVAGDLRQLSSWLPISWSVPSIASSQASVISPPFEHFQLQQPVRSQDPVWNGILLSIVDG